MFVLVFLEQIPKRNVISHYWLYTINVLYYGVTWSFMMVTSNFAGDFITRTEIKISVAHHK